LPVAPDPVGRIANPCLANDLLVGKRGNAVVDHVWTLGAANDVMANTGYTARPPENWSQQEYWDFIGNLKWRMDKGDRLDPSDFLTEYHLSNIKANRNLKLPMWRSNLLHVRSDMAAVLRRFDLGNTALMPIRIHLPEDGFFPFTRTPAPKEPEAVPGGVNEDYLIVGVGNQKPTIDNERSEQVPESRRIRGDLIRGSLICSGPVHPGVFAVPSALEGVDIWKDPLVNRTMFVSERLALALKAEPYARHLKLKKVRVAASGPEVAH
jgi:hypothetical protein